MCRTDWNRTLPKPAAIMTRSLKMPAVSTCSFWGLGHNGHIGFNEPADAFACGTQCVDLTESTINANKRFFASEDDVPRQAYTMGIGSIMKARKILVVVSGEDKARS